LIFYGADFPLTKLSSIGTNPPPPLLSYTVYINLLLYGCRQAPSSQQFENKIVFPLLCWKKDCQSSLLQFVNSKYIFCLSSLCVILIVVIIVYRERILNVVENNISIEISFQVLLLLKGTMAREFGVVGQYWQF
jgi:hypothetical protein